MRKIKDILEGNMEKNNKDLIKHLNKKPTYREEANALVHQCFRNSFLEDLHAGKHSKLLENPQFSRITQEEMKKLMIESSAAIARFLEFKERYPKKYKKMINAITLLYTKKWEKKAQRYNIRNGE
jgi:hypothetical protein